MTTRKTLFIDRIATLVLAVLLLGGGVVALWWWSGRAVRGTSLPRVSSTASLGDVVDSLWFAWLAAVVGVLLALVGIRWIAAHLTGATVKRLKLAGSDSSGRLDAVGPKVAAAAADTYADTLGVRAARGTVVRDRGQLVARVNATIEPNADLALLARRGDEMSAQLAAVLGRDDLRCSIELAVARRARALPRTS